MFSRNNASEDDQHESDAIVARLQSDDVGQDPQRREVGEGAWTGRAAAAGRRCECYRGRICNAVELKGTMVVEVR